MKSLAFDPTTGILYGATGSDRFYSIDPATGIITDINTNTDRNIDGLAFDTTGKLYGSQGSNKRFFEIDSSNGAITDINTNTARQIHAMVFVPEPSSLLLMACGALGLAALVVRRKRS